METAPAVRTSLGDRRRILAGLDAEGKRIATQMLERYEFADAASQTALKNFARSCDRLHALQTASANGPGTSILNALHRELRTHVMLLKALDLPK